MKNFWKDRLDERQENVLLKIEHLTCWVGFWGLLVVLSVQTFFLGYSVKETAGELIVFALMAITLLAGCISQGIWDRHLALSWKVNVLASALAGAIVVVLNILATYYRFGHLFDWIVYPILFGSCFILTFALLSLCSFLTKKRQDALEKEPGKEEE